MSVGDLKIMKYELSMCLASIRPQYLKNVYETALKACKRYSWELIVISPFDLPSDLVGIENIKHIKEFGNPVRATMAGMAACEGKITITPCDDGYFAPDSLDQSIDLWNSINCGLSEHKNCIVCKYREGEGFMNTGGESFPIEYWNMNYHLNVPHTEPHWKIAPQPMIGLDYLKKIGGFCNEFECMSFACWDICCRIQRDGGVFHLSPTEIMIANNVGAYGSESEEEAKIGGHSAIFNAHSVDYNKFFEINSKNRININFDDWKKIPNVWHRRWGNKTREELEIK